MKVYKCFVSGEEFYSDAKTIEPVTIKDGDADVDTGLVRVRAFKQTAGGDKVNVGGEGEFTKASEDDADVEETKWDQFWNFPAIENEHSFSSFKEFKDTALMPMLLAFKKLALAKGLVKDKDEIKEKGLRMAGPGFKWIQSNFGSIQFYSTESVVIDGADVGGAEGDTYAPNYAMLIDDGTGAYFYFFRDTFTEAKF